MSAFTILLLVQGSLFALVLFILAFFLFSLRKRRRIVVHRWQNLPSSDEADSEPDPLTRLANRRGFEKQLELEWRRALRTMTPISLVMIDVDFLGLFNERYGKARGDDCLQIIGGILNRQAFRPGDMAFRVSGEEFFLILPQTEVEGALKVVARFQDNLSELVLPHQTSPISDRVTVSVGVATMIPDSDSIPDMLLCEADRALYHAKKKGRNCVVCGPCH